MKWEKIGKIAGKFFLTLIEIVLKICAVVGASIALATPGTLTERISAGITGLPLWLQKLAAFPGYLWEKSVMINDFTIQSTSEFTRNYGPSAVDLLLFDLNMVVEFFQTMYQDLVRNPIPTFFSGLLLFLTFYLVARSLRFFRQKGQGSFMTRWERELGERVFKIREAARRAQVLSQASQSAEKINTPPKGYATAPIHNRPTATGMPDGPAGASEGSTPESKTKAEPEPEPKVKPKPEPPVAAEAESKNEGTDAGDAEKAEKADVATEEKVNRSEEVKKKIEEAREKAKSESAEKVNKSDEVKKKITEAKEKIKEGDKDRDTGKETEKAEAADSESVKEKIKAVKEKIKGQGEEKELEKADAKEPEPESVAQEAQKTEEKPAPQERPEAEAETQSADNGVEKEKQVEEKEAKEEKESAKAATEKKKEEEQKEKEVEPKEDVKEKAEDKQEKAEEEKKKAKSEPEEKDKDDKPPKTPPKKEIKRPQTLSSILRSARSSRR